MPGSPSTAPCQTTSTRSVDTNLVAPGVRRRGKIRRQTSPSFEIPGGSMHWPEKGTSADALLCQSLHSLCRVKRHLVLQNHAVHPVHIFSVMCGRDRQLQPGNVPQLFRVAPAHASFSFRRSHQEALIEIRQVRPGDWTCESSNPVPRAQTASFENINFVGTDTSWLIQDRRSIPCLLLRS